MRLNCTSDATQMIKNAFQAHFKCTSNASQTHLKRTSNAFQTHFKRRSNASQTHSKRRSNVSKRKSTAPHTRLSYPKVYFTLSIRANQVCEVDAFQTHSHATQTHLKRTPNAPQTHFKRTSNAFQTHAKSTANVSNTPVVAFV